MRRHPVPTEGHPAVCDRVRGRLLSRSATLVFFLASSRMGGMRRDTVLMHDTRVEHEREGSDRGPRPPEAGPPLTLREPTWPDGMT